MKTISMVVALTIAMGALIIPLSISNANADTICKFNKENQRCDLDIERLNGPFKLSIVNEQNNNGGGNGGGNVSTVDQQARDDIASNGAADAQLVIRVDGVTGNVTSLQGLVETQATEIQQLRADLQTLNASVITGISLSNGSSVVTPPVEPPVEPPVDNGTVIEPPVEPPIEPPVDNSTGNNGTGNGNGNFTG